MNKNLAIRTAVAAVAIPIILWICYQGGLWLLGMLVVFATVAVWEFLRAEGYGVGSLTFWLAQLAVLLSLLLPLKGGVHLLDPLIPNLKYLDEALPAGTLIFILCSIVFALGRRTPAQLFSSYLRLFWGLTYLIVLYPYVLKVSLQGDFAVVRGAPGGDWLLFLFGLLWLGDTAAMFVGKAFGKHKLAPTVSPNKTVEGFIGGIVGAIVVAIILGFWRLDMIPLWQLVVIATLCSIFGQLGDLVESMWKRSLGIKDSSAIVPGHGGVLDRFDSLLFAAPVMYFCMQLVRV